MILQYQVRYIKIETIYEVNKRGTNRQIEKIEINENYRHWADRMTVAKGGEGEGRQPQPLSLTFVLYRCCCLHAHKRSLIWNFLKLHAATIFYDKLPVYTQRVYRSWDTLGEIRERIREYPTRAAQSIFIIFQLKKDNNYTTLKAIILNEWRSNWKKWLSKLKHGVYAYYIIRRIASYFTTSSKIGNVQKRKIKLGCIGLELNRSVLKGIDSTLLTFKKNKNVLIFPLSHPQLRNL